jgi:hypothetical protein
MASFCLHFLVCEKVSITFGGWEECAYAFLLPDGFCYTQSSLLKNDNHSEHLSEDARKIAGFTKKS